MKTICKKIPLKEIATFLNGYAFKPSDWSKEGLPIIRIQTLTGTNKEFNYYNGNYNEKYIIENGDILISWSASLGIFLWENMRGILNQHIFKVIFDKNIEIDKTYFLHCMKFLIKKIEKNIHGSTMKHITRPEFEKIIFPIYEIDIQRKISKNLIFITKIIENNKKLLDELKELSKSLFTTMFGDIKTNDKNWEIYYWKDVLNIKNGKNQKQVEDINGKYPIYGSGGIIGRSNAYICNENSIIIGRKGNINKPILVKEKFWNVDTAFGLEVKSEKMSYHYLYYFCLFYDFEIHNKAVTIPSLVKSDLEKIVLPIPPMELQNKFAERIQKIEKLKFTIMTIILNTYKTMKKKGVEKN